MDSGAGSPIFSSWVVLEKPAVSNLNSVLNKQFTNLNVSVIIKPHCKLAVWDKTGTNMCVKNPVHE
jgi:hypothetical protein